MAVARTERIQKLSWQKLQYWMIAMMTALHRNIVTYGGKKKTRVMQILKQCIH